MTITRSKIAAFCIGASLLALPSSAQLGTATISGTVADKSGALVAGAEITVVNSATGFIRKTMANNVGEFNMPGLTPALYDMNVRFQGFKQH